MIAIKVVKFLVSVESDQIIYIIFVASSIVYSWQRAFLLSTVALSGLILLSSALFLSFLLPSSRNVLGRPYLFSNRRMAHGRRAHAS